MTCPYCGEALACATCGAAVEEPAPPGVVISDTRSPDRAAAGTGQAGRADVFEIVARGHGDLLDQLREVVGDLGWVRLMEDRRTGETILPREGRGRAVHVDRDITP